MSDKKESIKIARIVLDTKDNKQIDLTIDEAKELYDQLHLLFGDKNIHYIPTQPIVIDRYPSYPWSPNYPWVTYKDSTNAIINTSDTFTYEGDSGLSVSYCSE